MTSPRPPSDVAILAFPEITASLAYGMYDLFLSAGREWGLIVNGTPGERVMNARIVAATTEPFRVANDVLLAPHGGLDREPVPAIVCVPEITVPPGQPLAGRFVREIEWIRHCYERGATIATACSGAMLLAEAGLLEGQEATTHWAYCDILRERYPGVKVQAQRALVVSGEGQRLVMAGGGTAWFDLALYLIARVAGIEVAMQSARVNLIDWHAVGQQPFARIARSRQVEDAVVADCQHWIADHYHERAPVTAMIQRSGLPERSFKRRFQQATGMSPLEYVHTLRLEEAKQMLEASDDSVEAIANAVGYEDAAFFSRLFRRKVNLSPGDYRRRFGALRRAVASGGRPSSP